MRLRDGDPPAPSLALVAAVAVQEVAASQAPGHLVMIKWPNDLLVEGAKLSGILLERADDAVVIGFGVNLAFAPDVADRPTISLAGLTGAHVDPAAFLAMLAESFARWLGIWRDQGLAPIRARWLEAAHPVGTALSTSAGEGLFDGLDESGALRLRLADGSAHVIHAGDVFLI